MSRLRAVALGFLLAVAAALPAAAQCAMCARNAAGQDGRALAALNSGIFVLLIPPVAIMGGILFVAFRYRN